MSISHGDSFTSARRIRAVDGLREGLPGSSSGQKSVRIITLGGIVLYVSLFVRYVAREKMCRRIYITMSDDPFYDKQYESRRIGKPRNTYRFLISSVTDHAR